MWTRPRRAFALAALLVPLVALVALTIGHDGRASAPPGDAQSQTPGSSAMPYVKTTCADLIILGARGSGQDPTKNDGAGQEVSRSARAMADHLHGRSTATVRFEPVRYEASAASSLTAYNASVEDGKRALAAQFGTLARKCAHSRFALLGFSQGAQVVHEFAAGLSAARARPVAVIGMIADPMRNADDDIRLWSYGGKRPTGHGRIGEAPRFDRATRDLAITFCVAADEVCNQTRPPGSGADSPTHKHFYERPEHARSTGAQLDRMLERHLQP